MNRNNQSQNGEESYAAKSPEPHFSAPVPARRWALGLMILASTGALLATSDPEKNTVYRFETSSVGPRATLSATKPQARYLLQVRVTALGPEQLDTTASALATVHGSISASAKGAEQFVSVRFGASGDTSDAVSALTSFQLARPLRFTGDCAAPDRGTPCQAELELELALDQAGALAPDASLSIDWSVDYESRAFKPNGGGNDERIAAPWTCEIAELDP